MFPAEICSFKYIKTEQDRKHTQYEKKNLIAKQHHVLHLSKVSTKLIIRIFSYRFNVTIYHFNNKLSFDLAVGSSVFNTKLWLYMYTHTDTQS